mgnify:FL=1
MAKKKAEDMREQLKQIISFTRGPSAWEELLRTEADIRKKRQKMIYDQKERRKMFIEYTLATILVIVTTVVFVWGVGLILRAKGMV